jgi:hypothetical protein
MTLRGPVPCSVEIYWFAVVPGQPWLQAGSKCDKILGKCVYACSLSIELQELKVN